MSNHLIALMSPKGVGLRLFLLLAGAIVAIAVAADVWRLRQERTRVLAQLQREASLVTQAIQGQAGPLLHAADDGRLEGLLEDVRQAKDAECVGAYGLEGRLVRAAFEPGAAERAPDVCAPAITPQPVAEAVSGQWTLSGTYNVQVWLTADETPQGILKLVFDAARVSGPLQEFRNSILVERVLVLLAMGVTLWIGIALLVTRPIRRLTASVEEVARGNLAARISFRGRTEVGELARAFNRMAGRLDEAQEERRKAEESRAALERQFRHAERLAAVGKVASVIAHEVGTPLHVIAGRARSLGQNVAQDDPRRGDVETIREQVGRITRTMQQVLRSSRAIPARHEPVDLGRLVRDVAGSLGPEYARRSVRLDLSVPPGLAAIPADADGLVQVLLNLLHNALAATPTGGRVEIRATTTAARDGRPGVVLAVRDTGTGIPPEHIEQIFDPFFSTKRNDGTGLGLSICRDIVRAHDGAITVESARPGPGRASACGCPATGGRRGVPEARVLVVDDDVEVVRLLEQDLAAAGFAVFPACSGAAAVRLLRDTPVDAVVTDLRMPDVDGLEIVRAAAESQPDAKVIIITAFATIASAIDAVKQGAFDYVSKPFEIEELVLALERAVEDSRLRRENRSLRGEMARRYGLESMIGASSVMQEVFALVQGAARADLNVLVTGESGTGKELVARAIHYGGPRRRGPFVALNCAAIPETLLESELFGHVRGAFTGAATARKGLVEEAHGGTLFLDEISEMSVALQAKLLRVLEDREVRPLGSNRGTVVEFRAIASTNRDPRAQVEAGTFRPDLYYRLNVVGIHLPPLRERAGDVPRLARHFVEEFAARQRRPVLGLTPDAMALVESYGWPGNVRELENAIERAVAFARTEYISPADLPPTVRQEGQILEAGLARHWSLREVEDRYVERVLTEVQGDRERAAEILGVHPRTLERREQRRGRGTGPAVGSDDTVSPA